MSEQQSASGYHWTILDSAIVDVGILVLVGFVIIVAIALARYYGARPAAGLAIGAAWSQRRRHRQIQSLHRPLSPLWVA